MIGAVAERVTESSDRDGDLSLSLCVYVFLLLSAKCRCDVRDVNKAGLVGRVMLRSHVWCISIGEGGILAVTQIYDSLAATAQIERITAS